MSLDFNDLPLSEDEQDDDSLSFEEDEPGDPASDEVRKKIEDAEINLSSDQSDAKEKICNFVEKIYPKADTIYSARDKTITVGGYAGTGKTTMISHTANELIDRLGNPSFAFISFTNKACKILEQKVKNSAFPFDDDKDSIDTIHSFLHNIKQIPHGEACPKATHRIESGDEDTVFIPKNKLNVDIIFIDEASMIPENLYKQLGRYDVPVVAVGDHGQLPPVADNFNLMKDPDVQLEKIHRQAEENDIIKFCEEIREQNQLPEKYIDKSDIYNVTYNPKKFFEKKNVRNWQFLCFKNKSRVKINKVVRNLLGFDENAKPKIGDKVICLKNNKDALIYNGMIGKLTAIDDFNEYLYEGTVEFDNFSYEGLFLKMQFHREDTIWLDKTNELHQKILKSTESFINLFDFGYCITVHKCLSGDTIVETEKGFEEIKNIDKSGHIMTDKGKQPYRNKIKKQKTVYKIKTEHGFNFEITKEHGVDAWKNGGYERTELQNLDEGDFVKISLQENFSGEIQQTPKVSEDDYLNVRTNIYTVPEQVTPKLAELIGLLVADGTVSDRRFRLVKRHEDVRDRFYQLCKDLFDYNGRKYKKNGVYFCEICSVFLSDWLSKFGVQANFKNIPQKILQSPINIQKAFLRGLFESGGVNLRHNKVDHVYSSSPAEETIDKVMIMLANMGIISKKMEKDNNYRIMIYSDSIKIFNDEIGFIANSKQNRIDHPILQNRNETVPISNDELSALKKQLSKTNYNNVKNRQGYMTVNMIQNLDDVPKSIGEKLNYIHTKITNIKKTGKKDVYCVEVPNHHKFLQNRIVGWNSQGSEFKNVCLYHDTNKRNLNGWQGDGFYTRWLYTGCSRAKEKLALMGKQQ